MSLKGKGVGGKAVGDTEVKSFKVDVGRVVERTGSKSKGDRILETIAQTAPIYAILTRQGQDFPLEGLKVGLYQGLRNQLPIGVKWQDPCISAMNIQL